MRLFRPLLLVAGVSLLAGCVPPGGRQAAAPTAQNDPSNVCFSAIPQDARFAALRSKMAIDIRPEEVSLAMLSDKTRPSEEERVALASWAELRNLCFQAGDSFRAQYAPPNYQAFIKGNQARMNSLTARLYGGEIPFGEFNRLRMENSAINQERIASEQQRERDRAAADEAAEDDRRRQAIGQALQNMQNQQLINQQQQNANRIRQTNCMRLGNQTNCTTY